MTSPFSTVLALYSRVRERERDACQDEYERKSLMERKQRETQSEKQGRKKPMMT